MNTNRKNNPLGNKFQFGFFNSRPELWQASQLFEHLPNVCFFAKDINSRFVRMNAMNLEIYGLTDESSLLGKTDRDLHPPALAEAYIAEDQRVMESKCAISDQIWLVPYIDGRLQWFVCSKIPLTDSSGIVAGIAGVMYPIETPEEEVSRFKRVAPAVKYLDKHFVQATPLSDIAKRCGLSLTQFNRLFQELLQLSPSQYRTALRIQRARLLLRTTKASIISVAIDSGFFDHSHLNKHFRRSTGMTPTQYRQAYSTIGTDSPRIR